MGSGDVVSLPTEKGAGVKAVASRGAALPGDFLGRDAWGAS